MTHKLENNYTKEVLALLQKFKDLQQLSQPGDPENRLRAPKEFDVEGQWDLITELPQDWGNRLLASKKKKKKQKTCMYQGPGERSSDPTRDWARCVWVSRSVLWRCGSTVTCWVVRGTDYNSHGKPSMLAYVLWKEAAIRAITPTIVWPQAKLQGGNKALPNNRKLD